MKTSSYEDIKVWQYAHEFVLMCYKAVNLFPAYEQYGLSSQFRRASVSIPANIAEGYRKLSKADKLRFLNISQGSLEECRYYIRLSFDLNYINEQLKNELTENIEKVSWFLNAYIQGIQRNSGIAD